MKFKLNDNASKIRKAIIRNGGYCPCKAEKTEANMCPCEDLTEKGYCCCNLFIRYESTQRIKCSQCGLEMSPEDIIFENDTPKKCIVCVGL